MPPQELAAGPVRPARRQRNRISGTLVELLAIAEFLTQSRTDVQPVTRVHAEVTKVKQRVRVRPQQESVVKPVLTADCYRANMGCLQDGLDLRAGDGASAPRKPRALWFEGPLAKSLRASRGSPKTGPCRFQRPARSMSTVWPSSCWMRSPKYAAAGCWLGS